MRLQIWLGGHSRQLSEWIRDITMQGVIRPDGLSKQLGAESNWQKLLRLLQPYRWFLLLVILPTLLTTAYYYLIASNQYESSAGFVVRRAEGAPKSMLGLGQLFGLGLGSSQSQSEAFLVEEYLLSHDVLSRLQKEDRLIERFRRPGIDTLSRLWSDTPRPETLLAYYRKHVFVSQDNETGITHLQVHAFTPEDSYALTNKLLKLGEERINDLNKRTFANQIADSRRDLAEAEDALADAQVRLTSFRRTEGDIDPVGSGKAQIGLVTELSGNLVAERSKLESMGRFLNKASPQYRAQAARVGAIEAQLAGQSSRLAGPGSSIASNLGGYEDLMVRKEFATQRYTVAAAAYESAKAEARKQQLYLTGVVAPNMPVKSEFPERGRIVATVFFALLMAYAIGWLLTAGIKEHSL